MVCNNPSAKLHLGDRDMSRVDWVRAVERRPPATGRIVYSHRSSPPTSQWRLVSILLSSHLPFWRARPLGCSSGVAERLATWNLAGVCLIDSRREDSIRTESPRTSVWRRLRRASEAAVVVARGSRGTKLGSLGVRARMTLLNEHEPLRPCGLRNADGVGMRLLGSVNSSGV